MIRLEGFARAGKHLESRQVRLAAQMTCVLAVPSRITNKIQESIFAPLHFGVVPARNLFWCPDVQCIRQCTCEIALETTSPRHVSGAFGPTRSCIVLSCEERRSRSKTNDEHGVFKCYRTSKPWRGSVWATKTMDDGNIRDTDRRGLEPSHRQEEPVRGSLDGPR